MASSVQLRERRKSRQRYKIKQTSNGKLRLSVHRTNSHIYAQIIDDKTSKTVASASTLQHNVKNGGNKEAAILVGKMIAESAQKQGIQDVVFDRSGFFYHGRIKALADAAREGGLKF
jgi:large subunit ribosomal protein L18